ncbi:hypothetical protein ACHAWO_007134 [Cyclotella atomus]|jgi:hypothetical protein|uniref:LAGLIDADG homing endonuclease n=1 Tax=Cyclotella atomus TaxID=382360 RepID=A0ABD3PRV0_9STRA
MSQRDNVLKRSEAISIIDATLPGPNYKHPWDDQPLLQPESHTSNKTFFIPRNIHKIAKSLNFQSIPRKSRAENQLIELHNRTDSDERVRSLILLMYKAKRQPIR